MYQELMREEFVMFENLLIKYSIYDSFIVKHQTEWRDLAHSISIQLSELKFNFTAAILSRENFGTDISKCPNTPGVSFE